MGLSCLQKQSPRGVLLLPEVFFQYHQRESLEVNLVPHDIGDNVLEETVCRAISLTGYEVTPDDLHACHQLKNKDRVILKFKDRKLKR